MISLGVIAQPPDCSLIQTLLAYWRKLLVVMRHSDDDFSPSVPCFEIPDSFSRLSQGVTSIYHRDDFAGFEQLFDKDQVFFVGFRRLHHADLLASKQHDLEQTRQGCKSGNGTNPIRTQGTLIV